jgi:activator of 2-hydroxyglutaryl-CoA dehydratase
MRVELKKNGQELPQTVRILDYEKNGDCAAGTGAFIEQQAIRLKYSVDQIGEILLQTEKSALVAGRCSVFAKTDMVHAQQKGYPPPAILRGLCEAVVRNFKSTVCKGKEILPTVAFVGGLALNPGVVAALKQIFNLTNGSFIIPPFAASTGAIGCALLARNRVNTQNRSSLRLDIPIKPTDTSANLQLHTHSRLAPLSTDRVVFLRNHEAAHPSNPISTPINVYLGIDIGSVSTNRFQHE